MDCLCASLRCSPEDDCLRDAIESSPPTVTESSGSDISEQFDQPTFLKSPSSTCGTRKYSTAVTLAPNAKHPSLEGRPTLVLPNSGSKTTTLDKRQTKRKDSTSGHSKATRTGLAESSDQDGNLSKPPTSGGLHRAQSVPELPDISSQLRIDPPPLRLDAWSEPAAKNYKIRSRNYLKDGVKIPSDNAAFRLLTVDLVNCDQPIYGGLCAHPTERIQQALKRERETGVKELPPFVFAVNLVIPGSVTYHHVAYFSVENMEEIKEGATPFGKLMNKFMFGDSDKFRNQTFKLIPRIVEGNFVVRKAVGSKPSILGKKIKQYYIRGERYFEMVIDIASNPVAQRIVKLALGYAKTLVVDMMYLLEGASEETLPERIFGGVRMKNIDFRMQDGKRTVA